MESDKIPKLLISHSSMETMEQCLFKWFMKYIKKVKVDFPSAEANLGSAVHKVAENFNGGTVEEFKVVAKEAVKEFDIPDEFKPKVNKGIKNFWKYWNKNLKNLGLGKDNKEKKLYSTTHDDNFNMMIVIDLFYRQDNEFLVIDWKTNKKPRDATKQLAFYFYFLRMKGIIPEHMTECTFKIVYLCLDATDDYFEVEYKLTELELEEAANRIESFIKRVKLKGTQESKYRKKPGPLCDWCEYYKAGKCEGNQDSC